MLLSSGRKRASRTPSNTTKRQRGGVPAKSPLFRSNEQLRAGLDKAHKGKRILLPAKLIYRNRPPPRGEENHLFQYSIAKVNEDCKTAAINFDERYIEEGTAVFRNYPDDGESVIAKYSLERLTGDHELYNKHIGRVNKSINDEKEAERKSEEDAKIAACDDVGDLMKKFEERYAHAMLFVCVQCHYWYGVFARIVCMLVFARVGGWMCLFISQHVCILIL